MLAIGVTKWLRIFKHSFGGNMLTAKARYSMEFTGSAIIGHQSGLINTVKTLSKLRRIQHDAHVTLSPEAEQTGQHLRRNGYFRVDPGYPDRIVSKLQSAMSLADCAESSVGMGGHVKDSVRYIVDPFGKVPEIRELLTPRIAAIVRSWYRSEFEVETVRMWRIQGVPDDEAGVHHFGNLWHVDRHPVDVMKLFVQISPDVKETDSSFRLLSRPNTARAMRRGFIDQTRILAPAKRLIEDQTVLFDNPPGTAAFVDTNRCLHRAGMPRDGASRGMVQFMFRPTAHAPRDGDYFSDLAADPNVYEGAIA